MLKKVIVLLTVSCSFLLGGCAVSNMTLTHNQQINERFANLGTVKIKPFIDYRGHHERVVIAQRDAHVEYPLILSGNSNPSAARYLQTVLQTEARNTGIFTPTNEHPEYVMTGIIYSMAAGATNRPIVNQHETEINTPAAEGVYNFAQLRMLAVLKRDGKVVFRKTIKLSDAEPTKNQYALKNQSYLLDSTVTAAVRRLFSDMEYRLKH